ncbi:hypothetical protein AAZX31_11G241200 [Glycine max]|uniref:Uncharacterized protein n=2 Tax=Glycine subgen. Soja TaxID=1462606 RepID=C6SZY7_SOYBN|nr:uncharacterized protein LOC100306576 [Glycine max]XP_028196878.1 uncharacterized protein LOC114381853 [Glycine soja]ACU14810.1 unknown [Glycine max]KAG4975296.1 hypothetical protein JHK87_032117 [Glycine soja]KAG4995459.1 hypothetical protein JHK86_032286 [Glycine max]KAG5125447.1 hypothetical protein JHK82_032184 [Glycine max]KAG5146883.1 hypothetical protein JHK84_032426 [Glycine max]|eukprot:XP_003538507.1 uncharacterized protein LOC100306576 [Glycine max]
MSDIAMLVAEEYERRTKHYRKGGAGAVQERNLNVVSCANSFLVLKEKIEVQKKELVKWVLEPKTQFAIAASNSLFSA